MNHCGQSATSGRAIYMPLKHTSLRGGLIGYRALRGEPRFGQVAGVVLGRADRLHGDPSQAHPRAVRLRWPTEGTGGDDARGGRRDVDGHYKPSLALP